MKKSIFFLCFILLIMVTLTPFQASAYTITGFELQSKAVIVASLDTGTVLYSKNANERMYPASLTKIMTAVITIEKAKNLDTVITVSKTSLDSLLGTDSSLGGLKAGEQLTLRQLLHILLIVSANDAATVIANYLGGSVENFAAMMNEKAAELKMTNSHFANPSGLHDDNHYTTAADMYKLTLHALELPLFADICSFSRYDVPATNKNPARTVVTTNLMLNKNTAYYYQYVTGIKTGYTDKAGRCLVSSATKDGYNYICVVMGAPPKDSNGNTLHDEFKDTKNLYKWVFDTFEYKQVISKNDPVAEMKLRLAWNIDHISLYPSQDFAAIIPKIADSSSIITEPVFTKNIVDAPIKKGDILGSAKIKYAGEEIGSVNLIAGENINRSSMLYFLQIAKDIASNIWVQLGSVAFLLIIILLIILNIIQNKRRRKMKRVRSHRRI